MWIVLVQFADPRLLLQSNQTPSDESNAIAFVDYFRDASGTRHIPGPPSNLPGVAVWGEVEELALARRNCRTKILSGIDASWIMCFGTNCL